MRTNFVLSASGGLGPRLQDEQQLHNIPVQQMGNYQEYLKKQPQGLRELETAPVRQHMFGNPFKVNKVRTPTARQAPGGRTLLLGVLLGIFSYLPQFWGIFSYLPVLGDFLIFATVLGKKNFTLRQSGKNSEELLYC